jgi:hypothetical protein
MCHSNGNDPTHCIRIGKVGLITYDKDNETISMKKHVNSCYLHELKKWNVMVEPTKSFESVHPTCKRKIHPTPFSMTSPLLIIEDLWLKQLVLRPCGKAVFTSKHQLFNDPPTMLPHKIERAKSTKYIIKN